MLDDTTIPDRVNGDARSAIIANASRVDRAMEAGDVEQTVGSAKDLVECVAKVVLEALGTAYASREDLPTLAKQALSALKVHPNSFQRRSPMQQLTQAIAKVPSAVADLRHHDGTGHGRSSPSDLHLPSAEFAAHVAVAWSRWVLAALDHVLDGMDQVREAIRRIERIIPDQSFHRGELRQLLEDLRLAELDAAQQRGLGVSVGRRSVLGTAVADVDVVEPLAAGEEAFPTPFAAGVIEGLFIDGNGYIRSNYGAADDAAAIADRLGNQGTETLAQLVLTVDQADLAWAFDENQQLKVVNELRETADQHNNKEIQDSLRRIAQRIETLSQENSEDQP